MIVEPSLLIATTPVASEKIPFEDTMAQWSSGRVRLWSGGLSLYRMLVLINQLLASVRATTMKALKQFCKRLIPILLEFEREVNFRS